MQNNKKKRNFLNVVRKKTKMWPVNILKTEKRKVYFAYCKYPEKKGEKSMKKNIRLSEIDAKMEELCHQIVRCVERRRYRHAYRTVKTNAGACGRGEKDKERQRGKG